ncbi:response regulator receiver domain protein [Mageeibacillus indolicus UPII9-5]|uniref:Stage 0 sporulation protein A homolog n=2 Tax=Mageeibacillus indolicus TaxID=884684 RepID=D3R0D9_MAGIU|nr:response regulator [Mageeibacillus indolicus]ADC91493.1 response regulator receiver domain protein [Mageeibacillus indolicus UPII9-5]PNH18823.1 DNA-binding response regulator [Mageeibacillus indolicus]
MYKVIVVEDEKIIRKGIVFTQNWALHNCIVVGEAGNGKEGLDLIRSENPDIVVTDIRMPHLSGVEMLRLAREENRCFAAIILTGYSEFEYARQAIKLGVADYLLKPIDHQELSDLLAKIVSGLDLQRAAEMKLAAVDTNPIPDLLPVEHEARNKLVKQIILYISKNYMKPCGLNDLCREFNISDTYINRLFKKDTGYTVNDYLNRYRISVALHLLRNTDMRVYEIAELTGFSDYKYFSAVFRKYLDISPSSLREGTRNR